MIQEKDLPQAYKDAMKDLLKEYYDAYIKSLEKKPYSGIRTNLLKLTPERLKEILDRDFKKVPWVNEGFYFEEEKGVLSSHSLSENPIKKSLLFCRTLLYTGAFSYDTGNGGRYCAGR